MSGKLGNTEVRVLGVLEVLVEGVPVGLRATKVGAVLAMLALQPGQVISSERLGEGLWGEAPPPSAANTLQGYISHLRKAVGRASIVTRPPGYVLALPAEAIDAHRFERLVVEGREELNAGRAGDAASLLERALALWRGSALEEFAYEPFAPAEALRLEELRLVAREELAEAGLVFGRHRELVSELRSLVDQHPLRERLWGQLMRALYRCGRQAEALRAFTDLRLRLGEELGIDPSPALQRLEEAMLLQKPELDWRDSGVTIGAQTGAPTPRHDLPVPRSSFVGRDAEVKEVEELTTGAAIVTVVGPGGSGKSRLALEVARRLTGTYPGGIWLVELASVTEAAQVAQAVATAAGVREEPGRPLTESLTTVFERDALLVLDNCEHLVEASAALTDTLVRAAPTLTVLATNREPLRVDGEVLWRIPTLAVPEDDSAPAEDLIEYDAVRLFVDRATAQGNYKWGPTSAAVVARICRRLDGLPLAIELAAARTGSLTPAVIAERLDDRFELLTAGTRTALPRHQTLRATVEWSYKLLLPAEQVVFRRLSVFAGGWSVSAAEAVCGGEDLDAADVLDLVTALVDRSLVGLAGRDGALRFTMHETLRAYATERLAEAGEEHALRARHLAWTLAFAERQTEALAPQFVTKKAALDCVEVEHDNLRHALQWALSAEPDGALRLFAAIKQYWRLRGHVGEGRRLAESVLAATPDGDQILRAQVLREAGSLAGRQGDPDRSQTLIEQSITMFRDLGDVGGVVGGLDELVWLAMENGDWSRAEQLAQECLDIRTEVGAEHLASEAMIVLALVKVRRGDEPTARQLMDEALGYNLRHADDPCPVVRARAGYVAMLLGDFEQARQRLEEADRYNRETGQLLPLALGLGWLGKLAYLEDDMAEAERLLSEQLSAAREQGVWFATRHALLWLAKVAIRREDLMSARPLADEVHRMSHARRLAPDPEELETVAELLVAECRHEEAARLLGQAEAVREAGGELVPRAYRRGLDDLMSQVASGLESEAFEAAWAEGRAAASAAATSRVRSRTERR